MVQIKLLWLAVPEHEVAGVGYEAYALAEDEDGVVAEDGVAYYDVISLLFMFYNILVFVADRWVVCYICNMRRLTLLLIVMIFQLSAYAQQKMAEDYYADAFNEISDMLSGKTQLSIKRAVYLAEWAYYEGRLDYQKDFCDEIDRITKFLNLFYDVNKLSAYKTGKQIALNDYFFKPYSGNGYKPYIYDFEHFSADEDNWETQFVTKVLKTHCG